MRQKSVPAKEPAEQVVKDNCRATRRHYNAIRPHTALGYRAPAAEALAPAFTAWPVAQLQSAPSASSHYRSGQS
jgi:hypothetical protein